jgi:hypothetical protein
LVARFAEGGQGFLQGQRTSPSKSFAGVIGDLEKIVRNRHAAAR